MAKRFFIIIIVLLFIGNAERGGTTDEEKNIEINQLGEVLIKAKVRIRKAWRLRAGDLLKLMPTITFGRRGTSEELPNKETQIGISFNINQVWDINDSYNKREALKIKSLRQIETNEFIIRKFIDRKYLLKERLWKLNQIKKSLDNPMDIATMDEKIDELKVKIQEIEINIEKAYAEIEYACVDVER
jgi:hypothetical protein